MIWRRVTLCRCGVVFQNGMEATRRIKEMGFQGVILGVTGNGLQTDIDNFLRSGVDRVLLKPLNISKFEDALNSTSLCFCYLFICTCSDETCRYAPDSKILMVCRYCNRHNVYWQEHGSSQHRHGLRHHYHAGPVTKQVSYF
jgi:hypothetical protein